MVQLEDLCEDEEYEKARQSHAKQFTAYKQIRQDDLEKVKGMNQTANRNTD